MSEEATAERRAAWDHDEPYHTTVDGVEIRVHPDVFSPKYFGSTEFIAENMPQPTGKSVLDIGTGTGALAVIAAKRGAKNVVATDIMGQALDTARRNASAHGVESLVTVKESDVFSEIEDRFDVILWNWPFGPVDEIEDIRERQLLDPQYEGMNRFLSSFDQHVNQKKSAYIAFSPEMGHPELLSKLSEKHGVSLEVYAEEPQRRDGSDISMQLLQLSKHRS